MTKFQVHDKVVYCDEAIGTILEIDEREHGTPDYIVEFRHMHGSSVTSLCEENFLEKLDANNDIHVDITDFIV